MRFPSTSIRVYFQSLVADPAEYEFSPPSSLVSPPREKSSGGAGAGAGAGERGGMRPLTISIPSTGDNG